MKNVKKDKITVVCLLCILTISLILRVWGVASGLPDKNHTYTYNGDEYSHINILKDLDPLRFRFENRYYPGVFYPLFLGGYFKMLSMAKLISITGSVDFYRNNFAELARIYLYGRLLSVVTGLLCVFFIFMLAKDMYGRKAGLLSALWLGILPSHVIYSHYMEPDILASLFVIIFFISCFNITRFYGPGWYLAAGVSLGLAVSSKFSTIVFFAVLPLAHLLNVRRGPHKLLLSACLAAAISLCITSPDIIFNSSNYINQIFHVKRFYAGAVGAAAPTPKMLFYPLSNQFYYSMGIFLLCLSLAGMAISLARRTAADKLLLAGAILFYAVVVKIALKAGASHLMPVVPLMAVFAARFAAFNIKPLKIVLVSLVFFFTLGYTVALDATFSAKNEREAASEWIEENIPKGSSIGIIRMPTPFRHPDITAQQVVLADEPVYKFFIVDRDSGYAPASPVHKKIALKKEDTESGSFYEKLLEYKPDYIIANEGLPPAMQRYYGLIKTFDRKVKFLGRNFDLQPRGGDLLYIIDICIFKRKTNI